MKRLTLLGSILLTLGAFFASGVPAFSADNDTVTVTASVQADACLTVETSSINYLPAPIPFSSGSTMVTRASQVAGVASCSSVSQSIVAKGTDATGTGINWALTGTTGDCSVLSVNQFRHSLQTISGAPISINLTTGNQALGTLLTTHTGGSALTLDTMLTMPCTGSGGAGQTASTSIIFTATVQ